MLATIALATAFAPRAFAADKGSQFGVLYGFSIPDAQNTNMFHMFGVKGSAFFHPLFSAGGYILQSDKAGQKSNEDKFTYSLAGVEPAFHISTATGDTFIAVRIGVTKLQTTKETKDMTFSPYHYGVATGYDYYITNNISLGFEGSYLHVQPGRTEQDNVKYEEKSFNLLNFLVSVQVRL